MNDEPLNLSVAAQYLICDLARGCNASRNGALPIWIVMPLVGGTTMCQGQVEDYVVQELADAQLAQIGSLPTQECKLTVYGLSYYDRHLKSVN